MATISVPISEKMEKFIESQISSGNAENKAQVVRRALAYFAEEQACMNLLESEQNIRDGHVYKFTDAKNFEKQLRAMYK